MQKLVAEAETGREAAAFTQRALDLRAKFMALLSDAFNGDRLFLQALHSAFEVRLITATRSLVLEAAASCWRKHGQLARQACASRGCGVQKQALCAQLHWHAASYRLKAGALACRT